MNLSPLPIQKFFGNNGRPLAGGLLFTYVAGTDTKVATYTDASGLSQNTNPIVLDFRGECRLWIDPQQAYKFTLSPPNDTDPPTNPIWTVDNITAAPANSDNAANDVGSVNNISVLIPQISSPVAFTRVVFKAANTNTGPTTLQVNGGTARNITWQNIGAFSGGEIQAGGIYEVIYDGSQWQLQGPTLFPWQVRSEAEILAGVTPTNWSEPWNWVTRYGAKGDRVTDDLAAFNRAAQVAAYSKVVYIPPVKQAGHYYRLSNAWMLQGINSLEVYGVGIPSLLVIANNAGANCITVDASSHVEMHHIGIYGTSGSGSGIEQINDAQYNHFHNIWIGWCDADGFRNTLGISARLENVVVDQNNGFRPAALIGGLTDGNIKRAFYWPSTPTGRNNDGKCINCQANAAGAVFSVQVGDGGGIPVDSFAWIGGLIQGASSNQEIYIKSRDTIFQGVHIEPPAGPLGANWLITLDGCTEVKFDTCSINGDVRFINTNTQCGIVSSRMAGISLGTGSHMCYLTDSIYGLIATGTTTSGTIVDAGSYTIKENLINAANARNAQALNLRNPCVYFATSMEDWVLSGGVPTVPCGFVSTGGAITRSSLQVRSGTYSARIIAAADLTQGLSIGMLPINLLAGRRVTVDCWVYNVGTPGLAYIAGAENATTTYVRSYQVGIWEHVVATFNVDSGATSFAIRLTGLIGEFYYDSVSISVEEFTPLKVMDLDTIATPTVSYGGYPVRELVVAASATNITPTFSNPHIGFPFMLRFTGNRTVVHGGNILLAGGVNFSGTQFDILELEYCADGNFYEVGRSVI